MKMKSSLIVLASAILCLGGFGLQGLDQSHAEGSSSGSAGPGSSDANTNRFVFVTGEVVHPGPVVLKEGMTVVTAIQKAQGLRPHSDRSQIQLTHADGSKEVIDLSPAHWPPTNNPVLKPSDKVYVPKVP